MENTSFPASVSGTLQAPASKSYAQRAVAAALLCDGETTLLNMDLCDDTAAALDVARALGAVVEPVRPEACEGISTRTWKTPATITGSEPENMKASKATTTYKIKGGICGGVLRPARAEINIGESGLSTRMFTPIASLAGIPVTITGHGSILNRPLDMMTGPLRQLGVRIDSDGFLPVTVCGPIAGGEAVVDGSVSSQFVTGLLMALPLAGGDTTLTVENPTSLPYIDMTLNLLETFGIVVRHDNYRTYTIASGQKYLPRTYNVEGDWSGASCVLVAGAIAGEVTMTNLNPDSVQADVLILQALSRAGAEVVTSEDRVSVRHRPLKAFSFDATQCPDLFPALAALAANCDGISEIAGMERLKHKESDRAVAIKEEFGKMGISVDISNGSIMRITGGVARQCVVDSHNDHRIAMAAAVAALTAEGPVTIERAGAVSKSYPAFWQDLDSLRAK